jgi:hypothetical protein
VFVQCGDKSTAMKNNSIVMEVTSKILKDEDLFLTKVKSTLFDLLEQNINTKVELKLTCKMARTVLGTGEDHDEEAIFWSDAHNNYPATDLIPLYVIRKEKVLDAFAT